MVLLFSALTWETTIIYPLATVVSPGVPFTSIRRYIGQGTLMGSIIRIECFISGLRHQWILVADPVCIRIDI
jgi:hypothetical protein